MTPAKSHIWKHTNFTLQKTVSALYIVTFHNNAKNNVEYYLTWFSLSQKFKKCYYHSTFLCWIEQISQVVPQNQKYAHIFHFVDLLPRTSLMIQVKPKIYREAFKMQQAPMQIFL